MKDNKIISKIGSLFLVLLGRSAVSLDRLVLVEDVVVCVVCVAVAFAESVACVVAE